MPSVASGASVWTEDRLDGLREAFYKDGYVIVDGIFEQQDMEELRKAAAEVTSLTRQGKWPHRRVVGKQFPPYDTVISPDSWGVQHLMHPDLPNQDVFTRFYGSAPLLDIAAHLLQTQVSDMQLELFNLLIEPAENSFALGWHRDDIRADVNENVEKKRLAAPTSGIQWNACLYDDDCLFLVPGTHARLRTADEVTANQALPPNARPYDATKANQGFDGSWEIDPSSTLRVTLKGRFGISRNWAFRQHPEDKPLHLPILSWSNGVLLAANPPSSFVFTFAETSNVAWLLWRRRMRQCKQGRCRS